MEDIQIKDPVSGCFGKMFLQIVQHVGTVTSHVAMDHLNGSATQVHLLVLLSAWPEQYTARQCAPPEKCNRKIFCLVVYNTGTAHCMSLCCSLYVFVLFIVFPLCFSLYVCCSLYVFMLFVACLCVVCCMSLCCSLRYVVVLFIVCLCVVHCMSLCCSVLVCLSFLVCLCVVHCLCGG